MSIRRTSSAGDSNRFNVLLFSSNESAHNYIWHFSDYVDIAKTPKIVKITDNIQFVPQQINIWWKCRNWPLGLLWLWQHRKWLIIPTQIHKYHEKWLRERKENVYYLLRTKFNYRLEHWKKIAVCSKLYEIYLQVCTFNQWVSVPYWLLTEKLY